MTYTQALDFIHGIARFGSKPGLRRVRLLLERMGNPQKQLNFIHVAGTNGKGSTCAMLANILKRSGYKTGLYISPFVLDFRERIQINGEMIPPEAFAEITQSVKAHWDALDAEGDTPSEFETLVAITFAYFLREKTDIVVLEVGLGGRFDATNIIDTPLVSVITSLGLDHVEYLGDTIGQIAFEKCGIIKAGGITVSYPKQEPEALEVIMQRCAEEENPLLMGGNAEVLATDFFGSRIRYGGLEVAIPLAGEHQIYNTITVLETVTALKQRGYQIPEVAVVQGIGETQFPARLEIISREPLIVLDGAHNQSGAQVLGKALDMLQGRRIHAVMGMLGNKDVSGALREVLPRCASLKAVPIPCNMACMPPEELAALAKPLCGNVRVFASPEEGVEAALAEMAPGDVMLVCGSLYLASHIRPYLLTL